MSFYEDLASCLDDYMSESHNYGVSFNAQNLHDLNAPLPDYSDVLASLTKEELNSKTDSEIIDMFPYFKNLFAKMDEHKSDPMSLFSFTNVSWKQSDSYRRLTNILYDYLRTYLLKYPGSSLTFIEGTSSALIAAIKKDKNISFRKIKNMHELTHSDVLVSGFHDNKYMKAISLCRTYISIDITQALYDSSFPTYSLHGREWRIKDFNDVPLPHRSPLQGAEIVTSLGGEFSFLNIIKFTPAVKHDYVDPSTLSLSLTTFTEKKEGVVGVLANQVVFPIAPRHPVAPWDPQKPYVHSEYYYKEKLDGIIFTSSIYRGYFKVRGQVYKISGDYSGSIQYEIIGKDWYYTSATMDLHGWTWLSYYNFFKKYLAGTVIFPVYKEDISQVEYKEGIVMIKKDDYPYHCYHFYLKRHYTIDLDSDSYNTLFEKNEVFDGIREYSLSGLHIRDRPDKKQPNPEMEIRRTYVASMLVLPHIIMTKTIPGPDALQDTPFDSWEEVLDAGVKMKNLEISDSKKHKRGKRNT